MTGLAAPYAGVAAVVGRIPRAGASEEIAAAFRSQIEAFDRLSDASQAEIVAGVQRSLTRWWRWLSTGIAPSDADFDPLRDWARARATEGVRLEDLLRALRLAGQLGWEQLRRHAREDEAGVLLDAAGLLLRYVDRLSTVVTATYLAERDLLVSEEERRTRTLLDLLSREPQPDTAETELGRRLAVPLVDAYAAFAITVAGQPARHHAALAARLRRRGWRLAVTEGDRVVGLTWRPLEPADLDEGGDVLLVVGPSTPRAELAEARADVEVLAGLARRAGRRGRLLAEEHLLELILGRSPRLAARLRDRVVGLLSGPDHRELLRTARVLFACRLDRGATSAALHVHRNTLVYRIGRIERLTGLDLGSPRDLTTLYLALGAGLPPPDP